MLVMLLGINAMSISINSYVACTTLGGWFADLINNTLVVQNQTTSDGVLTLTSAIVTAWCSWSTAEMLVVVCGGHIEQNFVQLPSHSLPHLWSMYSVAPFAQHCAAANPITFHQALELVRFNAARVREHYRLTPNCDECVHTRATKHIHK